MSELGLGLWKWMSKVSNLGCGKQLRYFHSHSFYHHNLADAFFGLPHIYCSLWVDICLMKAVEKNWLNMDREFIFINRYLISVYDFIPHKTKYLVGCVQYNINQIIQPFSYWKSIEHRFISTEIKKKVFKKPFKFNLIYIIIKILSNLNQKIFQC